MQPMQPLQSPPTVSPYTSPHPIPKPSPLRRTSPPAAVPPSVSPFHLTSPPPPPRSIARPDPPEALTAIQAQLEQTRLVPIGGGADAATAAAAAGTEPASLGAFGVDEIRWLMHWLRGQLSQYFGDVRYIMGDRPGHADNLGAAQQVGEGGVR